MKIVVVGDIFVPASKLSEAAKQLPFKNKQIVEIEWKLKNKEDFQKRVLNIEENGPESEEPPAELLREIKDADILMVHFAPIPKKIIKASQKLRLIGICRGGIENIDIKAADNKKIPVIHVIRNAEAVAEFTIGLILSMTRNIAIGHEALKKGVWKKDFENSRFVSTLEGKTIGIVGLGHIGKLVAKKASAFGVHLLGYDSFVSQKQLDEENIKIKLVSLKYLFENSDIITLHLRLSTETQNIIGKDLIRLMRPTSYIVNTARAGLIEENSLIEALTKKKIAGAALDVFWIEPLSAHHPILKLNNVTITPHIAGTTVDAITNSPFLLVKSMNEYFIKGKSELIVNSKSD